LAPARLAAHHALVLSEIKPLHFTGTIIPFSSPSGWTVRYPAAGRVMIAGAREPSHYNVPGSGERVGVVISGGNTSAVEF